MTDQWVPGPPPVPTPPIGGLPPANQWTAVAGCSTGPGQPSIVASIVITDVPATIVAPNAWGITLNDGSAPPNFSIDHFDSTGALIDSPITIEGSSGDVLLTHDPTQPLGVATKQYADNNPNYVEEAPIDNTTYGRDNGTWVALPGSYMPEAPNTTQRYGRFNSIWQLDAIQTDAPNDGGAYARQNGAWTAAVTGGPYLPLTGGTLTGPAILQGSNMLALNSPLANGQSAILGQKAGLNRWQMMIGDYTAEGLNNVGSNFALNAFSTTGAMLGTWLSIARADGATTFNGAGVTIAGGLAVNGLLAVANVGNLSVPGGSNGQALVTNGSGVLSWATRLADAPSDGQFYTRQNAAWAVAPGGMTDAPNDGTAYARKSAAWSHLTHTDITDWTASLAGYALTTAVPIASSTPPLMDGVAAVGTATTYARADHVHPTDTHAMGDNRIINGDMRIDQRNGGASGQGIGYTVDRWNYNGSQASKGTWQRAGPPGALTQTGFPYYLSFTSSSAYAVVAADTFVFAQSIEADAISDFAWGTSSAQPVTLSFWIASSLTGQFGGSLRNYAGNRSYPFSFSLPAANTWTKIVVTIPGDTAGTWVMAGNAGAMIVSFDLGAGANFRAAAGAWVAGNITGATGAVSVVGTNGATFLVTGVKLEIGSIATPYNRQSLAKSMADCERYFRWVPVNVSGWAGAAGANVGGAVTWSQMRAAPTIGGVGADPNTTQSSANSSGAGAANITPYGALEYATAIAVGGVTIQGYRFLASAEL